MAKSGNKRAHIVAKSGNQEDVGPHPAKEFRNEKIWRLAEIGGLWSAALVGLTALIFATIDSHNQRDVMQGQLDEMRADQRPWIGMEHVISDNAVESNKPFSATIRLKNFGTAPSPVVKTCFYVGMANPIKTPSQYAALMSDTGSKCYIKSRIVLMPQGDYQIILTAPSEWVTPLVAKGINAQLVLFIIAGKIEYNDQRGLWHSTTICGQYRPDAGVIQICPYGNDAV